MVVIALGIVCELLKNFLSVLPKHHLHVSCGSTTEVLEVNTVAWYQVRKCHCMFFFS